LKHSAREETLRRETADEEEEAWGVMVNGSLHCGR